MGRLLKKADDVAMGIRGGLIDLGPERGREVPLARVAEDRHDRVAGPQITCQTHGAGDIDTKVALQAPCTTNAPHTDPVETPLPGLASDRFNNTVLDQLDDLLRREADLAGG